MSFEFCLIRFLVVSRQVLKSYEKECFSGRFKLFTNEKKIFENRYVTKGTRQDMENLKRVVWGSGKK